MWPSNTEVKNTLNQTGVLEFKNGNLQLKLNFDLDKTILDKGLLISAIDRLNVCFDQKEKLNLAVALRDYIYSCKDLERAQTDRQNFWKDSFKFLKNCLAALTTFFIFIIPLIPIIILIRWIVYRLDFWSAQKKQLNNKQILDFSVINPLNQINLINPLSIEYNPKLFEIPEKKQISELVNLSVEQLIERLAEKTDIIPEKFERHIGEDSDYILKNQLKEGLQIIYCRLNGDLDQVFGPLQVQETISLLYKFVEGINNCSQGFHDRVNTIIESFNPIENFSELLFLVRKSLVEKTAIKEMSQFRFYKHWGNEVHTFYDFTRIAHQEGLGIPLETDSYRGEISWDAIRNALTTAFEHNYSLFNLSSSLIEILRGLLIEVGYTGTKPHGYSYTVGTEESEVEKITQFIKKFLDSDFQDTDWKEFFIINDETAHITDINWEFINTIFSKQLTSENYFKIPTDKDFKKYLSNLFNYIKKFDCNYFTLLTQIQPTSFNLLFYRLEQTESKELKDKLIRLLFEKDETGLAPFPLIVHHSPEILIRFFCFIDSEPRHQKIIQALFIKHRRMIWDSFVCASENQPKSAFIFLSYIIQNPQLVESACHPNDLFSDNLSKIHQGLSNLMSSKISDSDHKTILFSFLSSYPATLPHPSQKIVDFLFDCLSHCEDEQFTKAFIYKHSALLLKNFSVDYFKKQNKNLALIAKKLLDAYADELIDRKNTRAEYTTQFFNWSFGYSATKKLNALTELQKILNDHSNDEKIERLNQLKSTYPSLNNGRLSCLFKACTRDIAITSQIKIQSQI